MITHYKLFSFLILSTFLIINPLFSRSDTPYVIKKNRLYREAGRKTVDQLILDFKVNDIDTRVIAAETLGWHGEAAKKAIPTLIIHLLNDDAYWVRKAAAITLGNLRAYAAIPNLIEALHDDAWYVWRFVRRTAAHSLGQMGSQAHTAIPELLNQARDSSLDDKTRIAMLEALENIRPLSVENIYELILLLNNINETEAVRAETAELLGVLSHPMALPSLRVAIQNASPFIRRKGLDGLRRCNKNKRDLPDSYVHEIGRSLSDPDPTVKAYAILTLGDIGEPALPYLGKIETYVDNENQLIWQAAQSTVVRLKRHEK